MPGNRGIRHAIASWIPNWLSNRAEKNTGYKLLYTAALVCDAVVETGLQGLRAAWPGKGTPTALPYIGQSRGLIRGLTETDDAYASRLRAWLTTWENAGDDTSLIRLLQTYLGTYLAGSPRMIRIVNRAGNFVTVDSAGVVTRATDTDWDWDEVYEPYKSTWWSDIWIIVYVDGRWPTYADLSDANWLAAWGTYDGFGTGHMVPREAVDGVKNLVAAFKGAHTYLQAIVFTTDGLAFTPGTIGSWADNPDGRWGNWSYDNGTSQVPARISAYIAFTTRFWIPTKGG